MIISRGRRYIFVHAPKTGGTALTLALEAKALRDDLLVADTPKARRRRRKLRGLSARGRLWKHATLADIDGVVTPEELDAFRVFTIVRNPWDRMVSYYRWLQTQAFDHPAVRKAKAMDFKAFLADPAIGRAFRGAPYASYVTDAAGELRCDLYLRLERLDADVARLEEMLGLRIAPVPHANRSDRDPDYRSAYDEASAARVAHICADDIARFGYSF